MNMTDSIADMLTRIRNAVRARHDTVEMAHSKIKTEIARVLKREGYICDYAVEGGAKKVIRVYLRYQPTGEGVIAGLKRISKPGHRVYVKADGIPRSVGMGTIVLTTTSGVLSDKEAREKKLGGEVLCEVW